MKCLYTIYGVRKMTVQNEKKLPKKEVWVMFKQMEHTVPMAVYESDVRGARTKGAWERMD